MNQLPAEKQVALLQMHKFGASVRFAANLVDCSPITVRRYWKSHHKKMSSISVAMHRFHQWRKEILPCGYVKRDCVDCEEIFSNEKCQWLTLGIEETSQRLPQNLTDTVMLSIPQKSAKSVKYLPCGKTRNDCVDCREIFSEGCGFCS
ncbi:hypothetical protein MUP77_00555 [Candidatus Bathyarchaeota archaeon]|nr:hypothetical protein [Candidatus Bathyarchaeota archaeon]